MKTKYILLTIIFILFLSSCGRYSSQDIQSSDITDVTSEVTSIAMNEASAEDLKEVILQPSEQTEQNTEELMNEFLNGNIMAYYTDVNRSPFYITDLPMDEEDFFCYSVGDRVDLDNDGELELILDGPYGGIYLDAREGAVYVLDEGLGTAEFLSYTNFDEQTWIVHSDTTHSGRYLYYFTRYERTGEVQDSFLLSQEFWETPDMPDGPDTVYTYRDKTISREEFMALKEKMLHAAAF